MTEPTEEVNVHPGRPPSAPAAASDSAASTSSTPSTGARAKSVSKKKAVRVPCRLRVSHSGEPEHTRKLARTHTRTHSHFIAEMCHRVWTSSSLPRGSLRGFLFAIKKCLLSAHASRGGGMKRKTPKDERSLGDTSIHTRTFLIFLENNFWRESSCERMCPLDTKRAHIRAFRVLLSSPYSPTPSITH